MPPLGETSEYNGLNPINKIDPLIHAPARLMVLSYLYILDSADYVFLMRMTGLSWGNLATHLAKLQDAGYISIDKTFEGKKPRSALRLTGAGREAFRSYKKILKQIVDDLPD